MAVRVVRLGAPRLPGEGLRIGTVRHPPRGVRRAEWAARNYFDVWFPNLAPSAEVLRIGRAASTERSRKAFVRRYEAEMKRPEASRTLDLLAALSHTSDFSVGCYCEDEARCHRTILRALLAARGATLA